MPIFSPASVNVKLADNLAFFNRLPISALMISRLPIINNTLLIHKVSYFDILCK